MRQKCRIAMVDGGRSKMLIVMGKLKLIYYVRKPIRGIVFHAGAQRILHIPIRNVWLLGC